MIVFRLQRVRALGFNAIQYFIPWNFHEIYEGKYNFSGMHNFTEFSRIAYGLGMYSLVRVGPYVCGEWENGGLPWWLLTKNITNMRTSDNEFKKAVEKWYSVLLPLIKPLMRHNGGPVLMLQAENEYGGYKACDRDYTQWLRDRLLHYVGDESVLYTTDSNSLSMLKCGSIPYTLTTVDFGPSSDESINNSFILQRKFLPNGHGPLVNSEFYPGWFVLWGQKEADLPSPDKMVKSAKYMYNMGANINFYMIHGGTNFGFWSGAEEKAPCITSYDYFAPISEAGDVTPKYLAIRTWIKSLSDWRTPPLDVPSNNPKKAFGVVEMKPVDSLSRPPNEQNCITSSSPMSFEKIGQPFGFVLYTREMNTCGFSLNITLLKDFGYVYLNKNHLGTFINSFNGHSVRSVDLKGCTSGSTLQILVENQGRQTYETINDYKEGLSASSLNASKKPLMSPNPPASVVLAPGDQSFITSRTHPRPPMTGGIL
ncbi:Beta-galactosidase [Trichostrongylus colubriformis]|uniref:Beta-galactosidase n=1 Tax=Trichostrongylus colubriformis TaxID=6319 RepID=A0AAN8F172_TRICO